MTQDEMFEASFQRPKNYFTLTPARQWEMDDMLGILDWDGLHLTDEQKQRFNEHYGRKICK
jgi:Spy/CpxP family protein refolding chaperone